MNGRNFKWWCEDINYIHAVLNREIDNGYDIETCDVLAVLEYPKVDIELTVREYNEEDGLIYDYYCCINDTEDGWHSYDVVDFGDVDPKEFVSVGQLMEDMEKQLFEFCKERGLEIY